MTETERRLSAERDALQFERDALLAVIADLREGLRRASEEIYVERAAIKRMLRSYDNDACRTAAYDVGDGWHMKAFATVGDE